MSSKIKTKTIREAIIRYSMIIAVLVLITTSMMHILLEVKDYYIEAESLKEDFLSMKKEQFKYNVDNGIAIINSIKKQYEYEGRDMEMAKQDAITIIEGLVSENSEYLFIGTYQGLALSGPVKNHNVIHYTDINGKRIIEELIHTAQSGGGYVDYVIPRLGDNKSGKKISYVQGIDDWNWYIGSGTYVDEIESMISEKRNGVLKQLAVNMLIMLGATALLFIVSRIISNSVSVSISKSVEEFTDFFKKAKYKDNKINLLKIEFEEFKQIGEMANEMLEARHKGEKALIESESRYRKVFEASLSGLWEIDLETNTRYYSETWKKTFGYENEKTDQLNWLDIIEQKDYENVKACFEKLINNEEEFFNYECRIKDSYGNYRWVEAKGIAINDSEENVIRIVGSHTDINTRKSQSEKIWKLAYYDELTHLPNRILFSKMIEEKTISAKKQEKKGSIFYIDIDNFHNINNLYGQDKGDDLLKKIAERLNKIQHNNLIGRISGDEFVILMDGLHDKEMIENIAELLIKVFETPFRIDENIVYITASIGIAIYPDHGISVDEILGNANTATQKSKVLGKNQFFIYDATLSEKIKRKMLIESCLKKALVNDEFELYYQPQIEFDTGKIIGFEALLRWPKFEYGSITPLEFIPIAEESGQILSIGKWVLENACIFAKKINKDYDETITVSVNVSAIQLLQYDFVESVIAIIEETGINAQYIAMELTETAILSTVNESSKKLKQIMDLGIKVYLDDFGIGYSSLSYLRNLPFHGIKIDKSFISGQYGEEHNGEIDSTIIKTIISMASSLNLATFAEGIETEFQKSKLNDYGCKYAQGFLFGRPLPKKDVMKLLEDNKQIKKLNYNL